MSKYTELFAKIVREGSVTIVVNQKDHLSRIRAGLSKAKKDWNGLASLTEDTQFTSHRFVYKSDENDPSKVTITLEEYEPTEFEIVDEKASEKVSGNMEAD